MDEAAIAEYSEAFVDGAALPPLIVYFGDDDFWLAEGSHHYHAYRTTAVPVAELEQDSSPA